MTIASEISRLQSAKASIKTAIENQGITVPSDAKLDTYYLYINQLPYIPVTGISLNASSVNMTNQSTYQLVATITPSDASNKNVTWTSSNTSMFTVSDAGLVTRKGFQPATATITATTEDGGYTATCSVRIVP